VSKAILDLKANQEFKDLLELWEKTASQDYLV
jgi:hypothetical protein